MHIAILCISAVAICTERVEAKIAFPSQLVQLRCCNLHGACGGKDKRPKKAYHRLTGCNLHGACGGKGTEPLAMLYSPLVAICTERVEAKVDKLLHIC